MLLKVNYKKDSYVSGFSICAIIIAGIFIYWGINAFSGGFWSFGISWMGFIWIGIGSVILFGQIASISNKNKLRKIVLQEFELNPNISLEDASRNTGISLKDVKAIVLDLKARGLLKGPFNTQTGQLERVPPISPAAPIPPRSASSPTPPEPPMSPKPPIQSYMESMKAEEPREKPKFCPNCGTPINRDAAQYCAFCGFAL